MKESEVEDWEIYNWTLEDHSAITSIPFYYNLTGGDNFTTVHMHPGQFVARLPATVALILCCFVSLVVNITILSSICFIRARVNNTVYISLSLAAADTFSLFFLLVSFLLFSLFYYYFPSLFDMPCFYILIECLRLGAIMTNMLHLVALSCIHYIGILNPFQVITRRHIQYCIVVLWTMPPCLIIFEGFVLEEGLKRPIKGLECQNVFLTTSKFRTRFSVPFFLTLGLMIFIYSHIYVLLSKHQSQNIVLGYRHRTNQVTKKTVVTTMMILGSVIIGWLPPFTFYALVCEDCLLKSIHQKLYGTDKGFLINVALNLLLILKPATNFYIYAIHITEIRGALRRMRQRLLACLHYSKDFPNSSSSTKSFTRSKKVGRRYSATFRSPSWTLAVSSNGLSSDSSHLRRCRSTIPTRYNRDTAV